MITVFISWLIFLLFLYGGCIYFVINDHIIWAVVFFIVAALCTMVTKVEMPGDNNDKS